MRSIRGHGPSTTYWRRTAALHSGGRQEPLSVVRINIVEVPDGRSGVGGPFANRAGAVDPAPGFLSFELSPSPPTRGRATSSTPDGNSRAFEAWRFPLPSVAKTYSAHRRGTGGHQFDLLSFEVVTESKGAQPERGSPARRRPRAWRRHRRASGRGRSVQPWDRVAPRAVRRGG